MQSHDLQGDQMIDLIGGMIGFDIRNMIDKLWKFAFIQYELKENYE